MTPKEWAFNRARELQSLAAEADKAGDHESAKELAALMQLCDKATAQFAKGIRPAPEFGGYYIESRSGGDVYFATASTCTCDAGIHGKQCWHKVAAEAMDATLPPVDEETQAPSPQSDAFEETVDKALFKGAEVWGQREAARERARKLGRDEPESLVA